MDDLFDYAARVQADRAAIKRPRRRRLTLEEIRAGEHGAGDDPEAVALYLDAIDKHKFSPARSRRKRDTTTAGSVETPPVQASNATPPTTVRTS